MSTDKERLTALEKQAQDTNERFTMLLGVIGAQGQDIKRTLQLAEQHGDRLNQISDTLARLVGRLDGQSTLLQTYSELLRKILARLPE